MKKRWKRKEGKHTYEHHHAMTQSVVGRGGRAHERPAEVSRPKKGDGGLDTAAERLLTGGSELLSGVAWSSPGLPGTGGSEISEGSAVALLSANAAAEVLLVLGGALAARGELYDGTRPGDLVLVGVRACAGVDVRFGAGLFLVSSGAGGFCFGGLLDIGGTGAGMLIGLASLGCGCGCNCGCG